MDVVHWLFLVCLALNLYCAGSAWIIQAANYPLFGAVAAENFVAYHREHTRRIGPVMIGPAFVANIVSVVFVFARPVSVPLWAALANAVLTLILLVVTIAVEIPKHSRLDKDGKSDSVIQSLIANNWPRTLAFTAQGLIILWLITAAFSPEESIYQSWLCLAACGFLAQAILHNAQVVPKVIGEM